MVSGYLNLKDFLILLIFGDGDKSLSSNPYLLFMGSTLGRVYFK